jgi:hypothetical protein
MLSFCYVKLQGFGIQRKSDPLAFRRAEDGDGAIGRFDGNVTDTEGDSEDFPISKSPCFTNWRCQWR